MKNKLVLGAIAIAALAVVGCNNSTKKNHLTTAPLADTATYPIPTAYEVTNLINRAGAAYILEASNPVDKVDSYLTESERALNLGVYSADLAYSTTYNMKQESMNYIKVLNQLINELQVSTNINTTLAEEVEKHINNKDSLIQIVTSSFNETYAFLVNNGKNNTSIQVMTGMWVEALYLVCFLTTTSNNPQDLTPIVAKQKNSLAKLMDIVQKNSSNTDIALLQTQLQPIVEAYKTVGDDMTLEQATSLFNVVEKVRTEIVK